jgi:hypothetical protein
MFKEQIKYLELLFIAEQKYAENINAPNTEAWGAKPWHVDHKLTIRSTAHNYFLVFYGAACFSPADPMLTWFYHHMSTVMCF